MKHRLAELDEEHGLGAVGRTPLMCLLELLADDPHAPTPARAPEDAVDVHVADSLSGLAVPAVREAGLIVDLGAGAGFPGLVLAVSRPEAWVVLVESVRRKAAWIERAAEAMGLGNVEVLARRAEEWDRGPVADVVTARALAALPVLVEYAAPMLCTGGRLVAWKGAPEPDEEADGRAAARALGLEQEAALPVAPFPGVRDRRLYVYHKATETPPGYPRRPGIAVKRPLRRPASDRDRR